MRPSRSPDLIIETKYRSTICFWWEEKFQSHTFSDGSTNYFDILFSPDIRRWMYANQGWKETDYYYATDWFDENIAKITDSYCNYLIEKDMLCKIDT